MNVSRKLSDMRYSMLAAATIMVMSSQQALAQEKTLGAIALEAEGQFKNFGKLIVIGSVVVGVLMVAAGLMKLKAAADTQGQQVKYGEGLWRLAVGAGLVGIPALTGVLASTIGITGATVGPGTGF